MKGPRGTTVRLCLRHQLALIWPCLSTPLNTCEDVWKTADSKSQRSVPVVPCSFNSGSESIQSRILMRDEVWNISTVFTNFPVLMSFCQYQCNNFGCQLITHCSTATPWQHLLFCYIYELGEIKSILLLSPFSPSARKIREPIYQSFGRLLKFCPKISSWQVGRAACGPGCSRKVIPSCFTLQPPLLHILYIILENAH